MLGSDLVGNHVGRKPVGLNPLPIELYLNLPLQSSHNGYGPHPGNILQTVSDVFIDKLIKPRVALVSSETDKEDRHQCCVKLKDDGLFRTVRQHSLGKLQPLSDIVGGLIQIGAPIEPAGDDGLFLRRDGGKGVQVIDGAQRIFYDAGDLVFNISCRSPRIGGEGADGGGFDLGEHIDGKLVKGYDSKQHDPQKDHDGSYRAFDAELREPHGPPVRSPGSLHHGGGAVP